MSKKRVTFPIPILDDPTKTRILRDQYSGEIKSLFTYIYTLVKDNFITSYSFQFESFQDPIDQSMADITRRVIEFALSNIPKNVGTAFRRGINDAERNISAKVPPLGAHIRDPKIIAKLVEEGIVAPLPQRRTIPGFELMSQEEVNKLVDINTNFISTAAQKMLSQLRLAIHNGLTSGRTQRQIVQDIVDIGKVRRTEAQRIARTEIIRAHTTAAMRRYLAEGITMWQWVAARETKRRPYGTIKVIEKRVCQVCKRLHGRTREIGKPFGFSEKMRGKPVIKAPDPHPNCRCTIIPYYPPKPRKPSQSLLNKIGRIFFPFEENED